MTAVLAVFGTTALLGALGVVICRKPVYSALSLVGTIGSLAVIFLLLNAQFLFAVQLIVYAGAVVVLFVFIIALLNPDSEDRPAFDLRLVVGVVGAVALTAGMVLLATNGITTNADGFRGAQVGAATDPRECRAGAPTRCHDPYHAFAFPAGEVDRSGNVQTVGGQLFTTFLLPFEITSLLLLVAAIGAVYLTRPPRASTAARPRYIGSGGARRRLPPPELPPSRSAPRGPALAPPPGPG